MITKLGFIVKRTEGDNEWAEKDVDSNRFIDLRHVSSDGTLDIYLSQGKESIWLSFSFSIKRNN